jgi:hypothetical protein
MLKHYCMTQRIIDRSYVGEVLQHIYTSELDIKINLFSEGGYFFIGHNEKRTPLQGRTIEEAVTSLASKIVKEFPQSSFSLWWQQSFIEDNKSGIPIKPIPGLDLRV